jgi:hypothetical protein
MAYGLGQEEGPVGWERTAILGVGAFLGTLVAAELIHLYKGY